MTEALIALAIALILVLVGATPAWLAKLATIGGIAFVIWVIVLVVKWLVGRA